MRLDQFQNQGGKSEPRQADAYEARTQPGEVLPDSGHLDLGQCLIQGL